MKVPPVEVPALLLQGNHSGLGAYSGGLPTAGVTASSGGRNFTRARSALASTPERLFLRAGGSAWPAKAVRPPQKHRPH
jgi:hypothetical protein